MEADAIGTLVQTTISTQEQSGISHLLETEELLLHILSYLTHQELSQAALVCKRWLRLAQDPSLGPPITRLFRTMIIGRANSGFGNLQVRVDIIKQRIVYGFNNKPLYCTDLLTKKTHKLPAFGINKYICILRDHTLFIASSHDLTICTLDFQQQPCPKTRVVEHLPKKNVVVFRNQFTRHENIELECDERGWIDQYEFFVEDFKSNLIAIKTVASDEYEHIYQQEKLALTIKCQNIGTNFQSKFLGMSFAGDRLAIFHWDLHQVDSGSVNTYSLTNGSSLSSRTFTSAPQVITSNEQVIVVAFSDGHIEGLNSSNLTRRYKLKKNYERLEVFHVHEGRLLIIGCGVFEIFNALTGESRNLIADGTHGNKIHVGAVAISGKYIGFAPLGRKKIEIWDTETGKKLHTFWTQAIVTTVKLQLENEE